MEPLPHDLKACSHHFRAHHTIITRVHLCTHDHIIVSRPRPAPQGQGLGTPNTAHCATPCKAGSRTQGLQQEQFLGSCQASFGQSGARRRRLRPKHAPRKLRDQPVAAGALPRALLPAASKAAVRIAEECPDRTKRHSFHIRKCSAGARSFAKGRTAAVGADATPHSRLASMLADATLSL